MILNFLIPTTFHPVGGVMAMFEFANAMARRGHEVHVTHVEFVGPRPGSVDEIGWCELDPELHHHFPDQFIERELTGADFVFCFDDRVPFTRGLPLMWVQAYGILGYLEEKIYAAPCPKICISRWLVDMLAERGVSETQRIHIPYGLRHDKYRLVAPIEGRSRRVAMLYNSHPTKGAVYGLDALAAVLERVPKSEAVVFGTTPLEHSLPDGVTHYNDPDQKFLIEGIYNTAAVFVSSSPFEGFGLAALEAMAGGCALVTAANGGSADYAIPGETALVAPAQDAGAIAAHVETLLLDDQLRAAMARRGVAYTQRFQWARSAQLLEQFLEAYLAEPARFLT